MAERLAPHRSQDQGPTSAAKGSVPSGAAKIIHHFEEDSTSDGEITDEATEKARLADHQKRLRKHLPAVPVPTWRKAPTSRTPTPAAHTPSTAPIGLMPTSYASQAAAATILEIYVGRSGGLRENLPNGRRRPRSVCVHTPNATIVPSALVNCLAEHDIRPTHLQKLPNGDLELTFKSVEDKEKFFSLPNVHLPRRSWQPNMDNPPPVWVRIFNKPAELRLDVVVRKFEGFGRVLFARENIGPDTGLLNGALTFKMVISKPVPSFVHLGPYCLGVRHYGQPQTCRKCDSRGHIAAQCSIKRCYNCGLTGHINADCPEDSRCQGCGSLEHHIVQCDAAWVPEADSDAHEPSSDHTPSESDSSEQEENDGAVSAAVVKKDAAVPHDLTLSDCPTVATQESDNAEQSPNWFDQTEHTAGSAGAGLAPEETAVTHACSSSGGNVGTENRQIAAPEESAGTQDSTAQDENGQAVRNWYDQATPSPDGMSPSLTFSSPLPIFNKSSADAGIPAASKRSFQDDSVSDISAVRRPSTKKKPKGRSARLPAPS